MTDDTDRARLLDDLLAQERVELERFGYDEVWELGTWLRDRLVADRLTGAVAVHLGEQRAFAAAAEGSSADLDGWLDRKARTVRIWNRSSFWVQHAIFGDDPDAKTRALQDPRGALVGVACCSGWTEEGEHALAAEAVHALAARQRG